MGLGRFLSASVISLGILTGCTAKSVVVRNKTYIDCCNPGLSYSEKDMCKWAKNNPGKIIVQGNNLYEMMWSDCKIGEEPWRKWE